MDFFKHLLMLDPHNFNYNYIIIIQTKIYLNFTLSDLFSKKLNNFSINVYLFCLWQHLSLHTLV